MALYKRKVDYFETEEGKEFVEVLHKMHADLAYSTKPSYSSNTELHPDNLISFVDKHMNYIKNHPSTNPEHYISNLRLMTRIR